ncbi:MAG: NUDIX hydrolase [Gemmatimonadetes bacterium]|nr:NUDIX hydrolase [Gemmatimonadota bacterium]
MTRATIEVRVQGACFWEHALLCALHRKHDAEYWVLPGGHLELDESMWDALVREFDEETGLAIEDGHLWALSEFRSAGRHVVDCTFAITGFGGHPRLGVDPEAVGSATLVDVAWLDREAFVEAPFRPTLLARHLRAHWGDWGIPAAYLGVEST